MKREKGRNLALVYENGAIRFITEEINTFNKVLRDKAEFVIHLPSGLCLKNRYGAIHPEPSSLNYYLTSETNKVDECEFDDHRIITAENEESAVQRWNTIQEEAGGKCGEKDYQYDLGTHLVRLDSVRQITEEDYRKLVSLGLV